MNKWPKNYLLPGGGGVALFPNNEYAVWWSSEYGEWRKHGKVYTLDSYRSPYIIDSLVFSYSPSDTSSYCVISAQYRNKQYPFCYQIFLLSDSAEESFQVSGPTPLRLPKEKLLKKELWMAIEHTPFDVMKFAISDRYSIEVKDSMKILIDAPIVTLHSRFFKNESFIRKGKHLVPIFGD